MSATASLKESDGGGQMDMEPRKTPVSSHPFSVESLISSHKPRKDFERRREDVSSQFAKTEIRDSCGSAGIPKHFIQTSPVKSESPEPDDCTSWVMNSRFSQTRKQVNFLNLTSYALNSNYNIKSILVIQIILQLS